MVEYAPMRAILVRAPFSDPNWLFERKLDGIRAGVVRRAGAVRLVSRSGQILNPTYPELVEQIERQDLGDLVADGEIVAFERGRTSFARLQRRMQIHDIERREQAVSPSTSISSTCSSSAVRTCGRAPCASASVTCAARTRFGDRLRWTPYRVGEGEGAYRPRLRPRLGGRDRQARRPAPTWPPAPATGARSSAATARSS